MIHAYLGTLSDVDTDTEVDEQNQNLDHVFVTNTGTDAVFLRLRDDGASRVLATWPIGGGFSGPVPAGLKLRRGSTLSVTASANPDGSGAPAAAVFASLAATL